MHYTIKRILFFTLCAFLASSCEKFLDVNTDISKPQKASAPVLLPPMLSDMARGEQFDSRFVGQFVQYWHNVTAGSSYEAHGSPSSDANAEKWRSHYYAIGLNVDIMIEDAEAKQQWNYAGVGRAIRAWSWQTSTDHHGDMILKQAWEPGRFIFDYDGQDLIYEEVKRLATESIELLTRAGEASTKDILARGDLVYQGDASKWVKFANGVLARNANHISNKSTYDPRKVIEFVDKSLASNSDNFLVPHAGNNTDDGNFYGPLRNNLTAYRPSTYIVSLLDSVLLPARDPRLPLLLTPSLDGKYRGINPGAGDPTNSAAVTSPTKLPTLFGTVTRPTTDKGTKFIFRDNASFPIMTYAELQFIKAEAALRANDKATALTAYTNGIKAHMDFVGVAAAARDKYIASPAVVKDANALTISDVMIQKYIALWGLGAAETWVDMRRYAYSKDIYKGFALPTVLSADNAGKTVQRARPRLNSEYVWNFDALKKIGADLPDYHTKPMWFTLP
jgi:hypothetical protein